jgi:hypothetical protein
VFTPDVEREEEERDCRRESDGLECWPGGREEIDGRTWTRGEEREEPAASHSAPVAFELWARFKSQRSGEKAWLALCLSSGSVRVLKELQELIGSTSGNSAVRCLKS